MDEAMKRRLVGVLVLVVVVFVISLLLPHPGTVKTDESNQRVTLDLSGKQPEELHTAPTPVPPVIAAAPAATEEKPTAGSNPPPPQIDEPPVKGNDVPAESMTDDEPPPPKPAEVAPAKPAADAGKTKADAAVAVAPAKPATESKSSKPALKLEDSLKQKPVAAAPTKPADNSPSKPVAKPPAEVAKATPPAAKPSAAAAAAKSHWFVQLGAFSEVSNAHLVLDKLKAKGLNGLISPLDSDKGTRYRARIGPYASRDLAKQAQDKAAKLGFAGSSLVED